MKPDANKLIYHPRRTDPNEDRKPRTYESICHELGFIPEVRFVRLTQAGTVTFTVGKGYEVKALYSAVIEKGFVPSNALKQTAKHC